jgi:protein phosphatase
MRIGRAGGLTDTGRRRLQNEDTFVCHPPLFAVADGMGGAQAGEIASRLAATALEAVGAPPGTEQELAELVRTANRQIFERATADPLAAGMGTTATVVVVDEAGGSLTLGHVGDSRAYRVRAGALERLTSDHSLVAELVRSGRLTEEEAAVHPARSVITRVLGTEPDVNVDTATIPVQPGDLILLCSDGLSSMLPDATIAALAAAAGGPSEATEALVAAANDAGGEDNITVVAFELVDGEPPERPATEPAPPGAAAPDPASDGSVAQPPPAPGSVTSAAGDAVRRHGAGDGSRWPALLLLAALALVAALALWWGLTR